MDEPQFRDMLVNGGRVSAEWLTDAYRLWASSPVPTSVARCLRQTGPREGRDADFPDNYPQVWHTAEICNRMMQRLRKAGLAEYRGKHWHPVRHDAQQKDA